MSSQEDFLGESPGESHPAVKFDAVGQVMKGTVIKEPSVVMRPSLKDGQPEKQLPINVECTTVPTGDLGERTLWVGSTGYLRGAIADAVKEAGATGLQVGGVLSVKFTEEKDTGKPNKARVFAAKYEPPAASGVSMDDVF